MHRAPAEKINLALKSRRSRALDLTENSERTIGRPLANLGLVATGAESSDDDELFAYDGARARWFYVKQEKGNSGSSFPCYGGVKAPSHPVVTPRQFGACDGQERWRG